MRVLMIDGHPATDRLSAHLLDGYAAALPGDAVVDRVAVRDLDFAPCAAGYAAPQPWEPDLHALAEKLAACDHLVIAFPLWWGAEPSGVKALLDRLLMPRFAFRYHDKDPWWDQLMKGRSADLIVTMDTPPMYLRLAYGNAIWRRWKGQVLGFCGFAPVRFFALGPVRQGGVERSLTKWHARLAAAARSAPALRRGERSTAPEDYLTGLVR